MDAVTLPNGHPEQRRGACPELVEEPVLRNEGTSRSDAEASSLLDAVIAQTRALVFDWNGTIVDDADRALLATNHVLGRFGCSLLDETMFGARFKLPMFTFFRELGIAETDLVAALRLWNDRLAAEGTRLQPDVAELLQTARQHNLVVGVVSAAAEEAVRADAVALGIDRYLSFIAGSATDKVAVLTEIATRTGGTMLYVGDTEYDMIAAQAAGAIAIGFGGGYRPRAALVETNAFMVIDDFGIINAALNRRVLVG